MPKPRIIVIGAGMGGLAAALRLAHGGAEVQVFDALSGPGGKARHVPTPAGPADAGPTVLTLKPVFDALFADVGARLEDHVTLTAEPLLARHYWPDGACLDLHADRDANIEAIRHFSGARSAKQYRRFEAETRKLFDAFEAPVMQAARPRLLPLVLRSATDPGLIRAMMPPRSLAARLARRFDDPRLAQLFGRYATYVGGAPQVTPGMMALIWQAEARGVWRVAGGLHGLARAIERLARFKGARFAYETPIAEIETRSGRARTVIDAEGTRHEADAVLFAGDPRALRTGRLGPAAQRAVPDPGIAPRSLSAEVWAFAARAEGRDLAHHTVFFGADPEREFGPILAGQAPNDPAIYVCAQDRGTGLSPPALERFEIIVNAAPLSPDQEAPPCHSTTFETLAARGLRLNPTPPETARTGPAEFERLFPASLGALYGRSPQGMTAALARPTAQSALPGLYLAGGGAHPGAGVPMATLSGKHAAAAIMRDRIST